MINSEKIINEFKRIRSMGFLKSNRGHNTGIGKTFEDYLGVIENNKKDHDFDGFEAKSQRELSKSEITLFTKCPSHPKRANRYIKDNFGYPDEQLPNVNVLHIGIEVKKFNTSKFKNKFGFKLVINDDDEKLLLQIKDLNTDEIVSDGAIYWEYKHIQGDKLKYTFFVSAETERRDGIEYFHYTKAKIYYGFKFKELINGLKNGTVSFEFRMGANKSGPKKGKFHDHGSGFRVKRENLKDLFEHYIEIE